MKTRLMIFALAAAVFCDCQAPEKPMFGKGAFNSDGTPIVKEPEEEPGEGEGTIEYDELKIMSFNVLRQNAKDPDDQKWEYRLPAIMAMLKEVSPDIIGLQECLETQYMNLLTGLGGDYSGAYIPTAQKNFGTCILYKNTLFSLKGTGHHWYSDEPDKPSPAWVDVGCDDPTYRTYIWVDLRHKEYDYPLYFYTTHFPRNYAAANAEKNRAARLKCAQAMIDHAAARVQEDDPVVFTGDFNCKMSNIGDGLEPFTKWMKYAWQELPSDAYDTYRAHNSFDNVSPIAGGIKDSVDYIWYRNLIPEKYRTIVEPYLGIKYISDHYPILFTAKVAYKKAKTE